MAGHTPGQRREAQQRALDIASESETRRARGGAVLPDVSELPPEIQARQQATISASQTRRAEGKVARGKLGGARAEVQRLEALIASPRSTKGTKEEAGQKLVAAQRGLELLEGRVGGSGAAAEALGAGATTFVQGRPSPGGGVVQSEQEQIQALLGQTGIKRRGGRRVTTEPFSRELLKQREEAIRVQFESRQAGALAGAFRAQEEVSHATALAGELRAKELNEKKLLKSREDAVARDIGLINNQLENVRAQRIDPQRFWKEKGTGSKIAIVIASALGGFVSGVRGGPNQALQTLQAAINNDLDAQEADIGTQLSALTARRGTLQQLMGEFNDRRQARAGAFLMSLERVKADANAIASASRSDQLKTQNQLLQGQLDEVIAQGRIDYEQTTVSKVLRTKPNQFQAALQAGQAEGLKELGKRQVLGGPAGAPDGLSKDQRQQRKDVVDRLDKSKVFDAEQLIGEIDQDIGIDSEADVPGLGIAEQFVPTGVFAVGANLGFERSQRALAARQTKNKLVNLAVLLQSGKQINEAEAKRIKQEIEGAGTEGELRNTARKIRALVGTKRTAIESIADPAVVSSLRAATRTAGPAPPTQLDFQRGG